MNFTYNPKTGSYTGFCIIRSAEKKVNKNGGSYLDLVLCDRSGDIVAKLWGYDEARHGEYSANMLVKVKGTISPYNGVDQFRVDQIRQVNEADNVRIEDYVPSAAYTGESMFGELMSIVRNFQDKDLELLVTEILKRNKEKLIYYPAASKLHHAMRGGLLMHTLTIVRLAQRVSDIYTFVDRELLLSGAILHDIAKIDEIDSNETGSASGYTVEGQLIGHLVMGAMEVGKTAEELGIDKEKAMLIEHMLISHHGEPEFGCAVRPLFLEAEILSCLDRLDARIFLINSALSGVQQGKFSAKQWALENRSFFNHGRVVNDLPTDLGI